MYSLSGLATLFLGFSTLCAYGALAEAIRCVPLPIVSVLLALNPLLTLFLVVVFESIGITWLDSGLLGILGYAGALSAMLGVLLVIAKSEPKRMRV